MAHKNRPTRPRGKKWPDGFPGARGTRNSRRYGTKARHRRSTRARSR